MDFSDSELKQIFVIFKEETEEHLLNINRRILGLEKSPDDKAIISELFREAHSIKGSARMLGIDSVQKLAHKIEDLLGLAKEETILITPEIIDVLCQSTDVILKILDKLEYDKLNIKDEAADKLSEQIDNLKNSLMNNDHEILRQENNSEEPKTKQTDHIIVEEKTKRQQNVNIDNSSSLNIIFHYLKQLDNKFQRDNAISEILPVLRAESAQKEFSQNLELFNLIIKNLEYIKANSIPVNAEIIQSLESAIEAAFMLSENVDNLLVIQRQQILKQMLELTTENEQLNKKNEQTAVVKSNKNIQNTNFAGVYQNYETGNIKTLRVDTEKLDKLENQVEELLVLKIKNKQNIKVLNDITEELLEIQKRLNRINISKMSDKKPTFLSNTSGDNLASVRNMQLHIEKLSEKIHDFYKKLNGFQKTFLNDDTRLNFLTEEINSIVKSVRILPLATIFHMFPRMVRDIARSQNKQVDIIISGSETSADKTIIEELKSPLIHIIRNAIDHGIEIPEERIAKGKNPVGKILLNSYHSENNIILEIIDDGKGLDVQKIKEKVLKNNLLSQEELNQLSEMQILNLIFWPGFSTEENVTEISGRGVGLDVVHTNITQLDGKVSIQTQRDAGFKIVLKIPITLATLKALLIKIQNQIYAISSSFVKTASIVDDNDIISKEGRPHIVYNDTSIRLIKLSEILNLPSSDIKNKKHNIVIVQIEETILALEVDEFLRTEEILQKKLNPPLTRVKNVSGVSSLSSGESCLILNLNDIVKSLISYNELKRTSTILSLPHKVSKIYTVLVVDDSFTTLTLEKNILKSAGYNVITAIHGAEALQKIAYQNIDMVITDIEMPIMSGIDLINNIKNRYKSIPVLIVTSHNEETTESIKNYGADDFILKKDFSESLFLNKIKEYLK